MNTINLKEFLNISEDIQEVDLSLEACNRESDNTSKERIKRLFDIALEEKFVIYFDGRYVMEPYEDLEFITKEEEFYYYNSKSYIVFMDNQGFKARIKIKSLKDYNYKTVYKIVEKACIYTKAHPEVSDYKLN